MSESELEWGQESEALFRSARRALSPSGDARARVRARLALKVGTAAAAAAAGTATTKAAASASGVGTAGAGAAGASAAGAVTKGATAALVAKIVAPLILVGAAATAGTELAAMHEAPSDAQAKLQTPAHDKPPEKTPVGLPPEPGGVQAAPASAAEPASGDEAQAPASPASPASPAPPGMPGTQHARTTPAVAARAALSSAERAPAAAHSATAQPPEAQSPEAKPTQAQPTQAPSVEETALVGQLDGALRSGDAARALRLAAEHEQKFPRGILTEEREGGRVIARCMTGAKSSSGAPGFLAAHPRSPMRARVLAACSTSPDDR